jgi:hypothetical protein
MTDILRALWVRGTLDLSCILSPRGEVADKKLTL